MIERDDEPTQVTRLLTELDERVEACIDKDRASIAVARARRRSSSYPKLTAVQPTRPVVRLQRLAERAEELTREILMLAGKEDRSANGVR